MLEGYDHKGDEEQGYEDAKNGFPRESTRPFYRRGYDRYMSELMRGEHPGSPQLSR